MSNFAGVDMSRHEVFDVMKIKKKCVTNIDFSRVLI